MTNYLINNIKSISPIYHSLEIFIFFFLVLVGPVANFEISKIKFPLYYAGVQGPCIIRHIQVHRLRYCCSFQIICLELTKCKITLLSPLHLIGCERKCTLPWLVTDNF